MYLVHPVSLTGTSVPATNNDHIDRLGQLGGRAVIAVQLGVGRFDPEGLGRVGAREDHGDCV